jgi:hypothetical protein
MSDLRLHLDTIDFEKLVELGRSMIPTVAPGWTDHNVHDPGIMLMELIAWVADAQVYSLARTRRDERGGYARILGLEAHGPDPAQGLIWPRLEEGATLPWPPGTIIAPGTAVTADRALAPPFFTTDAVALTTARLSRVLTRCADGTTRDWTRANAQQGATFLPFGDGAAKGDQLLLQFEGPLSAKTASAIPIALGFDIVGEEAEGCRPSPVRLAVTLTNAEREWPVTLAEDSTRGFSQSGVLLLRVEEAASAEVNDFTIAIASHSGAFLRNPRVRHVAANVLPIEQRQRVTDEVHSFGKDLPNQTHVLAHEGLMSHEDAASFDVQWADNSGFRQWTRTGSLEQAGPDDLVYEVDRENRLVTFGNGINGARPTAGSTLRVDYQVSAGARGNLPHGVSWAVRGVSQAFENRAALSGGGDADSLLQLRASARRDVREAHPLVTKADLEDAARSFTDLGVTRAVELAASTSAAQVRGTRILVAVGPHSDDSGSRVFHESEIWLREIQRRLAPRLPLGQRLEVMGPRFVAVRVQARVVAAPQRDVDEVRTNIERLLTSQLAIVEQRSSPAWPFGRDVTELAVKGWIRNVDGVARVTAASLIGDPAPVGSHSIALGSIGLPRYMPQAGDIIVERFPLGGRS